MTNSASYLLFAGTINALGFLGLFGVTLLPLRTFFAVRRNAALWRGPMLGKIALALVAVAGISAIAFAVPQVAGVFRCLTELHCGANRASGWFFLATLGAFYGMFELFSIIVLWVARRATRVAT